MSFICIFVTTTPEFRSVRRLLAIRTKKGNMASGRLGLHDVLLCKTGIGRERARKCADLCLNEGRPVKPNACFVVGTCGSVTTRLNENQVVFYSESISQETGFARYVCSRELSDRMSQVLASHSIISERVVGITAPRYVTTTSDKLLLASTGAEVVDMESYEVLKVAFHARIPAIVLRVVSDSLSRPLPDLNTALHSDGNIGFGRSLKLLAAHPLITTRSAIPAYRAHRRLMKAVALVLGNELIFQTP